MQNKESKFNWGIIGFGIGGVIGFVIWGALGLVVGAFSGFLIGLFLGDTTRDAASGSASEDEKEVLSSYEGDIDFIGFCILGVILIAAYIFVGAAVGTYSGGGPTAAGIGALIGLACVIFMLGVILTANRKIFFLLCGGFIGFAAGLNIAVAAGLTVGEVIEAAVVAAVVGAALGLTLAYLTKDEDKNT